MSAAGLIVEIAVRDRDVLVVGAGPVGQRRARRLIDLGARLRWVAPDAPSNQLQRPFESADCAGVELVFACAPPTVNAQVMIAAKAYGAWVCRADSAFDGPGGGPGDLRLLSMIDRGALRIAVSTAGKAPAAARAIREALEERVPVAWGSLVEIVADLRSRWPAGPERAHRLRAALRGPLAAVLESGQAPDRAALDRWLNRQPF